MGPPAAHYVALEIGRNVPKGDKVPAAQLCAGWNASLADRHVEVAIHPGYGATGNYLVECVSPLAIDKLAQMLDGLPKSRGFIVFDARFFNEWVDQLQTRLNTGDAPALSAARRPTRGAVMDRNTSGGVPLHLPQAVPPKDPVENDAAWTSSNFAVPRVRGVWKNDLLRSDGKALDPNRREGTWGALAKAMKRAYGGDWTARALSTLIGLRTRLAQPTVTTVIPVQVKDETVFSLLADAARGTSLQDQAQRFIEAGVHSDGVQALVNARMVAEAIARALCSAVGQNPAGRGFLDLCRDIAERALLSHKALIHLNTIRRLGNFANHEAESSDVESADIQATAWLLLQLVRELTSRRGAQ